MALGGGTFTVKNKTLPGAYLNFLSASKSNPYISERGTVCIPLKLDWGVTGEIFEVLSEDFIKNSEKIFGYPFNHEKLKGISDIFLNAEKCLFYRLNGGKKASSDFCEAKYEGVRGNDIKLVVESFDEYFKVSTYLDTKLVDSQTVADYSELSDNDFVLFNKEATLSKTAGMSLSGGENDDELDFLTFLSKAENEVYNILASTTTDDSVKELFVGFTKRMRDEIGVKFQTVLYDVSADYEGVISVKNSVLNDEESGLVYWVSGALAGCEISKSTLNKLYDGSFEISSDYTQSELENFIKNGQFVLHRVKNELRVLSDINTLVSGEEDFKDNGVIRVLDQIGNDIAYLFKERYLGKVLNDSSGRISLWNDIVRHHKELSEAGAIDEFNPEDIKVTVGNSKNSVVVEDYITPATAMAQLYMTIIVE